jgi:hypothetical protein
MMWHGPVGQCSFVYVNIRMAGEAHIYIYEYTCFLAPNVFYICCFVLMLMMLILSICCDRIYVMFM